MKTFFKGAKLNDLDQNRTFLKIGGRESTSMAVLYVEVNIAHVFILEPLYGPFAFSSKINHISISVFCDMVLLGIHVNVLTVII